jgi:hypothetical protein
MSSSPRKRQANRLNAQRSTGPRSAAGRRVASQNARAHGLSVALNPNAIEPQTRRIAELIREEGISGAQGRELALKILDYERNVQHERETFAEKFLGVCIKEPAEEEVTLELLDAYFADATVASERGLDNEERQERRAFRAFARLWRGSLRRQEKEEARSAMRYLRRSGNQLVKAFKSLGT